MNGRVLIVDDEPEICDVVRSLLVRRGCEVRCAHDGREGLMLALNHEFDVVITDVLMPDQDGVEMLLALKRVRPKLPVLVMSGGLELSPEYYLRIAHALGADRLLIKPFTPDQLYTAVRGLLQ